MKRILLVLFIAALCSFSGFTPTAPGTSYAVTHRTAQSGPHHRGCYRSRSRFTPDRRSAVCAVRILPSRYRQLMLCVAYTESRYELGVSSGSSFGPWEVDPYWHPWADTYKLTHSWSYNAYAIRRISWHPPKDGQRGYYDFHAWHPDCAIG